MRSATRILYALRRAQNGLGAPRARPRERSGDHGAPASERVGGSAGAEPPGSSLVRGADGTILYPGALKPPRKALPLSPPVRAAPPRAKRGAKGWGLFMVVDNAPGYRMVP